MTVSPYDEILETAVQAAEAAGRVLRSEWECGEVRVNERARHDVKLTADVEAETAIMDIVRRACPEDGIVSEEFGLQDTGAEHVWVIDPLDGTVNFSHGHPHFATSIAWLHHGRPVVGVVYDPLRREMFSAVRGQGAFLNGAPIQISAVQETKLAMLAVGFSKLSPEIHTVKDLAALAGRVQKLRISGSSALDSAYTACGRLDGYCENSIYVWDVAAGRLIAEEAGGRTFIWQREQPCQCGALVTIPALADELMTVLEADSERCVSNLLELCSAG